MTELPWRILLQFLLGKIKPDVLKLLLPGTLSKGADMNKWETELSKKLGKGQHWVLNNNMEVVSYSAPFTPPHLFMQTLPKPCNETLSSSYRALFR